MDPNNSDIEIVCLGEKIRAHKLILTSRSLVFSAMLQSNMVESISNEIIIDYANKDVLKKMVHQDECINCVLENASACLNQDWEDQIKESPRMMLQILKHFLKEHTIVSQEISRSGREGTGLIGDLMRATAFLIDSEVKL